MRYILLFEKFTTEYKGYLTGSLAYLYKHKKELENKISVLDRRINTTKYMLSVVGGRIDKASYKNRMDYIINSKEEKDKLHSELDHVNSEILKYTKRK